MASITRRRWASRDPRPLRKRGKKASPKQRNKSKVPSKPRLVRRYVRRKADDTTKVHPTLKHPTESQAGNNQVDRTKPPTTKISVAGKHNDVVADSKSITRPAIIAEITAVPNPIPDSGITAAANATNTVGAGSPLLGGTTFDTMTAGLSIISATSVAPFTTTVALPHSSVASFSALPPLNSFAPSSVGIRPAATPTATFPTISAFVSPTATSVDSASRQISVALVILVSVGSALLLLGFCIVVKMCAGSRRRPRPTPSLPIIKGTEADDDFYETKESPIFGGEERMSTAMAANGPMWNWVQYPHTKLSGPTTPPVQQPCLSQQQQNQTPQYRAYPAEQMAYQEPRFNLATEEPSSAPANNVGRGFEHPPVRNMNMYHNTAAVPVNKRISRQSLSFYAPPNTDAPSSNARQETAYTADGRDLLKRSRSKTASRRFSQPMAEERKNRNSTLSFVGLAYDGEEAVSPPPVDYGHVIQDSPVNHDFPGRARVKSGYFAAGTYPRMSTLPSASYSIATATRINVAHRNSFSKDKFGQQKGTSKRTWDTQALTYALGLASPRTEYGVLSPHPTIYPDDSVSVMDTRRKKNMGERKMAEAVPDVPVIVPTDNAGSTDSLMGMNFGVSQMSLTGLALGPVSEGEEDRENEASVSSSILSAQGVQTADKAPRVPSPPPLPSLAQMGLQRNNPEAYDNYRSPTYSLYGLYQTADRKSYVGR